MDLEEGEKQVEALVPLSLIDPRRLLKGRGRPPEMSPPNPLTQDVSIDAPSTGIGTPLINVATQKWRPLVRMRPRPRAPADKRFGIRLRRA